MQPTHARWKAAEDAGGSDSSEDNVDTNTNLERDRQLSNGTQRLENGTGLGHESSYFSRVDPVYRRNFIIHDLSLETAPESNFSSPGYNAAAYNYPFALPDQNEADILDELPFECREAMDQARRRETAWRSQWNTESTDGMRGKLLSTVEWFP
jgi:chromatin structure-remodeling complex protein RSC7